MALKIGSKPGFPGQKAALQAQKMKIISIRPRVAGTPGSPARDPIEEEGGWNLYRFLKNDGINEVDLLGFFSWSEFGAAAFDALQKFLEKNKEFKTTKECEKPNLLSTFNLKAKLEGCKKLVERRHEQCISECDSKCFCQLCFYEVMKCHNDCGRSKATGMEECQKEYVEGLLKLNAKIAGLD